NSLRMVASSLDAGPRVATILTLRCRLTAVSFVSRATMPKSPPGGNWHCAANLPRTGASMPQQRDETMTQPSFSIHGAGRPSRWLVTCDHATNRVPDWVAGGSLGIADEDMARHIAWDPGAAGVTRAL